MPNITRGGRMTGLMSYLVGTGRSNEHREPHLVAGDSAIMAWHDDSELDNEAALQIGWELDHPRRAFGAKVTTAIKDDAGHVVGQKDAHVWHCSLTLRSDEPAARPESGNDKPGLSDEQWAAISEQFVADMGFADPASDEPPCRWVALRHGPSKGGNDHVHIVVGLVHEDGTKANVWNDRKRAQKIAGELERKHGLQVLASRDAGHTARGEKPAERAVADRRGAPEVASAKLARTVRACAAAASDEAEFVRRVRAAKVRIRPRYASGRGDVVSGYSVALPTAQDQATMWYGGGRLARDLTLPRLRADWPDTPEHATGALAEWGAAKRNRAPSTPGREATRPDAEMWARYTTEVTALREQLRAVPADDRALWAHVARETAGAFAAWSISVEGDTPGPLAATADILARSAQLRADQVRPRPAGLASARGAALLLASVAHGGSGPVAHAALLRQLVNTARALHDAHVAAGDAQRAAEISAVVTGQLQAVAARLPSPDPDRATLAVEDAQAVEAARLAAAGQLPPRAPGSPVPAALDPPPSRPGQRPGIERPDQSKIER